MYRDPKGAVVAKSIGGERGTLQAKSPIKRRVISARLEAGERENFVIPDAEEECSSWP